MRYNQAISVLKLRQSSKFALRGDDNYLKEFFIETAKSIYSDQEVVRVYPDNQVEALDVFKSSGLFGCKLVILCDYDKMKIKVFEKALNSYEGCVILTFTPGSNIKSREFSVSLSGFGLVECKKLYVDGYTAWVKTSIIDSGFDAESRVEDLIYSRIGPNLWAISHELEKLYIVKDNKKITLKDVELFVSDSSSSNSFELFDNLLRQNVKKALLSFDQCLNDIIYLNNFLIMYFEKMFRLLLLKEEKLNVADIADILGLSKYYVKIKYLPLSLALGKSLIASKIDALCDLEVKLRLYRGDKRILFEKFIMGFSK